MSDCASEARIKVSTVLSMLAYQLSLSRTVSRILALGKCAANCLQ
jgi:hypothetical protein